MQTEAHFDAETIERLEEQSGLLLKIYEAEFAKDPTSPATAHSLMVSNTSLHLLIRNRG